MSAAADLLNQYQHVIRDLTLITGSGGVFEVVADGNVLYSKRSMGRHAHSGEVLERFRDYVGPSVEPYPRDE